MLHVLTVLLLTIPNQVELPEQPNLPILVLKQTGKRESVKPSQQYLNLLRGFTAGLAKLPNKLPIKVADIHDEVAMSKARKQPYRILVCLGTGPASVALNQFGSMPMIYSMVLDPSSLGLSKLSLNRKQGVQGGILARISPKAYIDNILLVHPEAQNIGMLYARHTFREYGTEIALEGNRRGLRFTIREIQDKKELVPKLKRILKEQIDLFLMLPDAITFAKAHRYIFLQTIKKQIPVMGPSIPYVKAGALWGVVLSPYDIGLQTAEMLQKALDGKMLSIEYPHKNKLTFNQVVAHKLQISFPKEQFLEAQNEGRVVE